MSSKLLYKKFEWWQIYSQSFGIIKVKKPKYKFIMYTKYTMLCKL